MVCSHGVVGLSTMTSQLKRAGLVCALLVLTAPTTSSTLACMPQRLVNCAGECLRGNAALGCLSTVAGQCSFPRSKAVGLCDAWSSCHALNCNRFRDDCQARGSRDLVTLGFSFGESDVFARNSSLPATTMTTVSHAECQSRHHVQAVESLHELAGVVSVLRCTGSAGNATCQRQPALPHKVRKAADRLTAVRSGVVNVGHRVVQDPTRAPPLLLYSPVHNSSTTLLADQTPSYGEAASYRKVHSGEYFLSDVLHILKRFYHNGQPRRAKNREGFFVEVGGFDGRSTISNSYYFERYLGWRGLLVEASPANFAQLFTARPFAHRLESALCAEAGTTRFSAARGCCGKLSSSTGYAVRCTPVGALLRSIGVSHVDFFSLDVEGSEALVLAGMDWTISVGIFLIESCTDAMQAMLHGRGFVRLPFHASKSHSLNQIWYHPAHVTLQD